LDKPTIISRGALANSTAMACRINVEETLAMIARNFDLPSE
jgi:hypothetical protein